MYILYFPRPPSDRHVVPLSLIKVDAAKGYYTMLQYTVLRKTGKIVNLLNFLRIVFF